jgi:hypothetical protein
MKDFLNQDLAAGDHVIMGSTVGQGRGFRVMQVVKFSTKMVQVTDPYATTKWGKKNTSVYADQLVKILPEQLTWWAISR